MCQIASICIALLDSSVADISSPFGTDGYCDWRSVDVEPYRSFDRLTGKGHEQRKKDVNLGGNRTDR